MLSTYGSAVKDALPPIGYRRWNRPASKHFVVTRRSEAPYAAQLRTVAERIGRIVHRLAPDGIDANISELMVALNRYGDLLNPWAQSVAARMIADADRRNKAAWVKHSQSIGRALRQEIEHAPTGEAMRRLLAEQVNKITSLPRDSAARLFHLTQQALPGGMRASEIAKEIMRSGEVSASRATMLARTAVSSTATALTQARAEYVGSIGYTWKTSRDGDVRPSHRKMEGKFVRWDEPPTLDGWTAQAGQFVNCRCSAFPVLPDRI